MLARIVMSLSQLIIISLCVIAARVCVPGNCSTIKQVKFVFVDSNGTKHNLGVQREIMQNKVDPENDLQIPKGVLTFSNLYIHNYTIRC